MLFKSWLDALRIASGNGSRRRIAARRRQDRQDSQTRLAASAEWLEDRTLLSGSGPDIDLIVGRAENASSEDYVAAELIIRFEAGTDAPGRTAVLDELGADVLRSFDSIDAVHVSVEKPAEQIVDDVRRFIAHTSVSYAEPNYYVESLATPDDPNFDDLWGMHNTGQTGGTADADIDAPEAWAIHTGTSNSVVAVIDSGIEYTHPDLSGNMWTNPGEIAGNGLDDDGNGYIDDVHGYDFSDSDADIIDNDKPYNGPPGGNGAGGHGSHVAGTVGATGDNNVGVAGVNWDVSLLGAKIFPNATIAVGNAAVDYVTTMKSTHGINITAINASYGHTGFVQSEKDAIEAANNAGIVFVAAAGNGGADNIGDDNDSFPYYPASYDLAGLISVAATDDDDDRAGFSNFGQTSVDLGAPGVAILSTVPSSVDSSLYDSIPGTSMASPHVAGAVGLLRGVVPTLTVAETKAAILDTVDPVSSLDGKTVTGGRLNLFNALASVAGVVISADDSLTSNKANDGVADNYVLKRDGADLVALVDGLETVRIQNSLVDNITVIGSDDADTLLVDHRSGLVNAAIVFNAVGNNNVLETNGDLDFTLADNTLSVPGTSGLTMFEVDTAVATGGPSANTLDATDFTEGSVHFDGSDGDDTLLGSVFADTLDGGDGNDTFEQTVNAHQVLSDTSATGRGSDTLANVELAVLTAGANNNLLDARDFSGSVTLIGLTGADTLWGAAGNDSLDGGDGDDLVQQEINTDQVLVDTLLTGDGQDTLVSIEAADLAGGASDNTLDAIGFTNGPVTLSGLAGDDTLVGSVGDDSLEGGDGTDLIQQTADADQVLTDTQVTGVGTDALLAVEEAVLTGGVSSNTLDATDFTVGQVTLLALDGNDTLIGSAGSDSIDGGDGTDQVQQTTNSDQELTDSTLTGRGTDSLASIEEARLTGGIASNLIKADLFTGPTTLSGLGAHDTLWGGGGDDLVDGGPGLDLFRQSVDAQQVLADTQATGDGTDTLVAIESGWLDGGASGNDLNATAFTRGPVTLDGGAGDDTLRGSNQDDDLRGSAGSDLVVQVVDATQVLTDTTLTGRGDDVLSSLELADLAAGGGNTLLDAGGFSGQTTLSGGAGNDTLVGAGGDDDIRGGTGNDEFRQAVDADQSLADGQATGDGDDLLDGINRAQLTGGTSDNRLDASAFTAGPVTLLGLGGDDTLTGGAGNDRLEGGDGSDEVHQQTGNDQVLTDGVLTGHGSDLLLSVEHAVLTGDAGANTIDASAFTSGGVTLVGADGDDSLIGGTLSDQLDGGNGTDTGIIAFDGDLVLTDTTVIGPGSDTVVSIERFQVTGGTGPNRIDASAYTLGAVTLDGGGGDDTLLGSSGDDDLIGGSGNNVIEQTTDADMVLTNSSLTGMGTDTLSGFRQAALTGGASANLIDASGFTRDSVTLTGADGDDTLIGSTGDDSVVGGPGHDALDGFSGDDRLDGTDGDDTLSGGSGSDTLDGGDGTDQVDQVSSQNQVLTDSTLTGLGTDQLVSLETAHLSGDDDDNTIDATAFTLGSVTLSGNDGDDTLIGSFSNDLFDGGAGIDRVFQVTNATQVLTDTSLTGRGLDSLQEIEEAELQGGASANLIDASAFTLGSTTLLGESGTDTLKGSLGDDSLDGGLGIDWLIQTGDVDMAIDNATLTGLGHDTHRLLERIELTGGAGDNRLDASGFSSGLVTVHGGAGDDTLLGGAHDDALMGGDGTDLLEQSTDSDQVLNNSQVTGLGTDAIFSIERAHLRGGGGGNLLNASSFTQGPVTLNGEGGDDTLIGSPGDDLFQGGSGQDLLLQSVDGDQVANNSAITGLGTDTLQSVEQLELTGGPSDNRLNAVDFTLGPVTLNGAAGDDTLLGSPSNDSLNGGAGIDWVFQTADVDQVLTSSSLTGRGTDVVDQVERAIITGGNSDNVLNALGFDAGEVTLIGSLGNDTLFGSPGNDEINGGEGTDLLVSTGDVDQVLSDAGITGAGNDTLLGIETAHLAGGDSDNTLDASSFSGPTTLEGGNGNDTLLGGAGDDVVFQSGDVDHVLTPSTLTGLGTNTLQNIDRAWLVGGDGDNLMDAHAFTPGPVTLDGAAGDDTLRGSAGDDQIQGGSGTDRVVSASSADQVLTDASLSADSTDQLDSIEEAELFGGPEDNLFDAQAFSGNTTLHGSQGNDTMVGGSGTDLLVQVADVDQVLTDTTLSGLGNDEISSIELAQLTGGAGSNTLDAQAFTSGSVTLDGAAGNDTLLGGSQDDVLIGSEGIDQVQQSSDTDQALSDAQLTGQGTDSLDSIEEAQLSGGDGDNLLDATAFDAGPVTLLGQSGTDTLRGSTSDDFLSGGSGFDQVDQVLDADQELTNSQLTGHGTDQLEGIETALLTGGPGHNTISASSFTNGPVTLIGAAGDDTLTGGSGDDQISGDEGDDVFNGRGGDDLINGGDGNDVFSGGSGGDTLNGDAGDDTIAGQGGRDSISGSSGDDELHGEGSPDTIVGGEGDDIVTGGPSGDVLNGSSGNDLIDGGDQSDRIFGGSGADTVDGGPGADRLNGQGGSGDVILGNGGDDTVRGGGGNDTVDGGEGHDELREGGDVDFVLDAVLLTGQGNDLLVSVETARLTGGRSANVIDASAFPGPVTLRGSGGNDMLVSSTFDDLLLGGNGNDTLDPGSGLDTLNGGGGFDKVSTSGDGDFVITNTSVSGPTTGSLVSIESISVIGGESDNILDASGFTGDTTLWGGGGRDVITGGTGNDWLNGNDGVDELRGGAGDDLLHGGEGDDVILGLEGNDTLNGEAGDDTIDGGDGDDQLVGADGQDRLLGRAGNDRLFGGPGNDVLIGHEGADQLNGEAGHDTLLGETGADAIWGGNGNDVLVGDDGNDRLFGQSGRDTLLGLGGNDHLQGGTDRDMLQGGDGDDTLNGQSGHDTVTAGEGRDRINPLDNSVVVNELFMLPGELFDAIDNLRA